MIFGNAFLDFFGSDGILHIVRIIVSVIGAIAAWFVFDPVTRITYRMVFRAATPGMVLFGSKAAAATAASLLIYFFLPLGGGGGGFGWGAGSGGGPGKGPGTGDGKTVTESGDKNGKPPGKDKTDITPKLTPIEIEIVPDNETESLYFRIKGAKPISETDLEKYFKEHHAKIEVLPVLTRNSPGVTVEGNPLSKLLDLTKKYNIKTLQTKTP